jgi:hypothetical protein
VTNYFIAGVVDYVGTGVWVNAAIASGTGDILWCPKDGSLVIRNHSQCALLRLTKGNVEISGRRCTEKAGFVCIV